ncbi:hypothetical protein [sulfur-oxidizing endosymbiont of Gigantopelta aegis]|uniref:hypothetical protein n=1 Tax=sulfur-oxidizing endosymbiont of Gigantopelta aegis TaxID=2794934 RepID=UPI0018DD9AE7|nr:hypothetical protein [sulfur-oxidizing endosymbiont of Gigantopelta aegis]
MSNKKVGITTAITAIIIMAFLIIYLAKPCDGDYKFSLKEMSFECSLATINPDPTPGPSSGSSSGSGDITTTPDDSNNSDKIIHACINNKIASLEAKTRQEVVSLGVAAGLGKYFACKTVTVNKEKISARSKV